MQKKKKKYVELATFHLKLFQMNKIPYSFTSTLIKQTREAALQIFFLSMETLNQGKSSPK